MNPQRVLIVQGDVTSTETLAGALKAQGYDVAGICRSVDEASKILGAKPACKGNTFPHGSDIFETALENADCAVAVVKAASGSEVVVKYCNKAFEKLSGISKAGIEGKSIGVIKSSTEEDGWAEMFEAIYAGREWKGEIAARADDGREFSALCSVAIASDSCSGAKLAVVSLYDNTQLRRMDESLRQSQKIEAVGRLASGIAHDFNNLLSVINSYSDLQIMKLEEGSPSMKYARQIRAAGRKGVDLVSQLMTFSRKDRPSPMSLDLAKVVEEIKGMLRRVIREDIEMETHYQDKLPHIKADQGQIEQILLNLCVNARDAMPNGGKLCIEVLSRDYERSVIREHDTIHHGRYVVLAVTDTGCGMDEETQKRIFDPFFTTKEIGKGTGLGLATVQSIVKQYNGFIIVKSRPGDGSRFEVILPASDGESLQNSSDQSDIPAPTGSEKIFIVEDDETFLDCITALLRIHGYQVYSADDGSSALSMLSQINYDIDLLVSDLVLPKLSGREVAARVVEKNSKVKVLFMTGYDDQLDNFYSLPGDATVLEKPFPLNSLLVKIRSMLDEGEGLSK
jgi:two-component system, cell cycle sensor histidine kinase and response regulator CckA